MAGIGIQIERHAHNVLDFLGDGDPRIKEEIRAFRRKHPGANSTEVIKELMGAQIFSKRTDDALEAQAESLLTFSAGLDPSWSDKIRIAREETGFSALQLVGAWIGSVLDAGAHMLHPKHPYFERGFQAAGTDTVCVGCGKQFMVKFAGQTACSDRCWNQARGKITGAPPIADEPPFAPATEDDAAQLTD